MHIDIQITKQLFLVTQLFEKVGDRIFATYGLTIKTHEILLLIAQGSNTTTMLAEAMNLALPGITQKTKVLEKREYIRRSVSKEDLRTWHFEVTKKGKNALNAVISPYTKATEMLYSEFSQSEKTHIFTVLDRIAKHLSNIPEKQLKEFIGGLMKK